MGLYSMWLCVYKWTLTIIFMEIFIRRVIIINEIGVDKNLTIDRKMIVYKILYNKYFVFIMWAIYSVCWVAKNTQIGLGGYK